MTDRAFLVMGFETSCDETGVAVVEACSEPVEGASAGRPGEGDATRPRSNVVASSERFHRRFGGIVPEIASRKQVEVISAVAQQALDEAGVSWPQLGAVAVTYAPGLVGSLVVGVCFAKAVAFAHRLPLVAVHHIEAHIYAHFLAVRLQRVGAATAPAGPAIVAPRFPFLALVVSGGHSDLVAVRDHGKYQVLGRTRDDAAGEAFDKGARLLGLGYPGGPAIDAAAAQGARGAVGFPRARLDGNWDFSFSGVKTALARYLRETPEHEQCSLADLAASYQEAVVEPLVEKSVGAAQSLGFERLVVAGGVANNTRLRELMPERAAEGGIEVRFPAPELCTDNGAMVASAGYFRWRRGQVSSLDLDARASAELNAAAEAR